MDSELLKSITGKTIESAHVQAIEDNCSTVVQLDFTDGTFVQFDFRNQRPKGGIFMFDTRGEVAAHGELEA